MRHISRKCDNNTNPSCRLYVGWKLTESGRNVFINSNCVPVLLNEKIHFETAAESNTRRLTRVHPDGPVSVWTGSHLTLNAGTEWRACMWGNTSSCSSDRFDRLFLEKSDRNSLHFFLQLTAERRWNDCSGARGRETIKTGARQRERDWKQK